jgi:hypothetical protein
VKHGISLRWRLILHAWFLALATALGLGVHVHLAAERKLLEEFGTILHRKCDEVVSVLEAKQQWLELLAIQDASAPAASTGTGALAGINVSFKVDPRISKGLYMGDRWVPVPYSQMGETRQVTVEARAEGVDLSGRPVSIDPSWIPADPDVATVAPGQGKEVRITALRPGESSVQVISEGVSRQLALKAAYKGDVLHVEISQKQ